MFKTLKDGTETWVSRIVRYPEENYQIEGEVVGWIDASGELVNAVEDRLQSRYLRRTATATYACLPLAETGFEVLSMSDAITLGLTTTEYHAGLRTRLLRCDLLQDENELAEETRPPTDKWEMLDREGAGDWEEWNPVHRVPYPDEGLLARRAAVGWCFPNDGGAAEDRFRTAFLMRDRVDGEVCQHPDLLAESGIESLSLRDALILGFSTAEYQTALRVRLLERRHVADERDLAEAITLPPAVVIAFTEHGRAASWRVNDNFLWHRGNWEKERNLREWLTRRERQPVKKVSRQPEADRSASHFQP